MIEPRAALALPLEALLADLLAARGRAGRLTRGLAPDAPFVFDRPETIGADELEELLDTAPYRRERYRAWYGPDERVWPAVARDRSRHALEEIEALRAELWLGPIAKRSRT